ncbi:MAG: hypothetical protein RBR32_03750 [Bacteroidales bacterium]|nr:hypothetical protein [Bacteroidales bacterium]
MDKSEMIEVLINAGIPQTLHNDLISSAVRSIQQLPVKRDMDSFLPYALAVQIDLFREVQEKIHNNRVKMNRVQSKFKVEFK